MNIRPDGAEFLPQKTPRVRYTYNSVALVHERTIPTERPPSVGEFSANFCGQRGVTWSAQRIPTAGNLSFLDRSRYFLFKYLLS